MIHRIRMARKRLMVARERFESTYKTFITSDIYPCSNDPSWHRFRRRGFTLRTIKRRKDRIA